MFAFCFFVFFSENTRKRSNILFFSGVKVVEQKKSIFLVEKNCTRKKRKNPPEESEFFFFFYVWVVKLFLFSSTCVLPLESFHVGFFPICENSHTKKTRRRRSDKQHFFSCMKPKTQVLADEKKTTSVINKIWLKNFVSVSERETNIYYSLNMKLRIN